MCKLIVAELKTKHLTLRPLTQSDRENLIDLLADKSVAQTYMLPDFDSRAQYEPLADRLIQMSGERKPKRLIYGLIEDGTLIGMLNDVGFDDDKIEIGYAVRPKYQNQGYATEAFSAVIRALFGMGFSCVRAGYFEGNDASRRVMEKCGLLPTGETETIEYRGVLHRCILCEIRA